MVRDHRLPSGFGALVDFRAVCRGSGLGRRAGDGAGSGGRVRPLFGLMLLNGVPGDFIEVREALHGGFRLRAGV